MAVKGGFPKRDFTGEKLGLLETFAQAHQVNTRSVGSLLGMGLEVFSEVRDTALGSLWD